MVCAYTYPQEGRPAVAVTIFVKNVAHDAGLAEMKLAQALLSGLEQPRTAGRRPRKA